MEKRKMCWLRIRSCFFVATLFLSTNRIASSQDVKTNVVAAPEAAQVLQTINKGLQFLRQSQATDGTFSIKAGPGITALAITAAIRCGEPLDSPMVSKGLAALETFIKPDGGIYGNGRLTNYETCIGIICFAEANASGKYNSILQNAKKFVTGMQYGSASDSTSEDDIWNGGVSYGGKGRPDLSNTVYLIEALRALEAGPDDPAIQAALAFVSRCQNLDSEHNKTEFASKVNDGGFYYEVPKNPIDPTKDSEAYTPDGGMRSYGTMTYAGYKSMLYAGLTASDPRVASATKWIRNHYSTNENPGKEQAGIYYYYQTFSAALNAAGNATVTDSKGELHDWRNDLVASLAARQAADGSWANENRRWLEDDKNLATSFALFALANCRPQSATAKAKEDAGEPK
jgi:hypothetical protein